MSRPGAAPSWKTIARALAQEGDKLKGARFLARAAPIDPTRAEAEAKALLASAQAEHDDAVHHGWAYRVAPEPADFRWSDGGEPIGTAGRAILQRIDALGVVNVCVVVSRTHGGQKLAAGDLAKGYGDAARALLAGCETVAFVPTAEVAVTFEYAHAGPVQGVLAQYAASHVGADYGGEVRLVVRVASGDLSALEGALRDVSAGRARVERIVSAG